MKELPIPIFRGFKNDSDRLRFPIKNEYIVFSFDRVKNFFLNFKEVDLNRFDSKLISVLEDVNFWFAIRYREKNLKYFSIIHHILPKAVRCPNWIGRSILTNSKEEIEPAIEKLKGYIENIHTHNSNFSDAVIRIQSLIACLKPLLTYIDDPITFPYLDNRKHIYGFCGRSMNGEEIYFKTIIKKVEFLADQKSACKIYCEVYFTEEKKLSFEVYAFTPAYFSKPMSISGIFPPHIIVEYMDIPKVKHYLLSTLDLIKVSSRLELIFKLGVFTNSFLGMDYVKERLYYDLEYKFKIEYFDFRQ